MWKFVLLHSHDLDGKCDLNQTMYLCLCIVLETEKLKEPRIIIFRDSNTFCALAIWAKVLEQYFIFKETVIMLKTKLLYYKTSIHFNRFVLYIPAWYSNFSFVRQLAKTQKNEIMKWYFYSFSNIIFTQR